MERERLGRHCMVRCPAAAQVDLSGPLYSSIQLGEGMHDPGAGLWPRASGSLPLSFIHPHLISHLSSTLSHPSRNVADCIVCHVVPFLFFFFSFLPFFLLLFSFSPSLSFCSFCCCCTAVALVACDNDGDAPFKFSADLWLVGGAAGCDVCDGPFTQSYPTRRIGFVLCAVAPQPHPFRRLRLSMIPVLIVPVKE